MLPSWVSENIDVFEPNFIIVQRKGMRQSGNSQSCFCLKKDQESRNEYNSMKLFDDGVGRRIERCLLIPRGEAGGEGEKRDFPASHNVKMG